MDNKYKLHGAFSWCEHVWFLATHKEDLTPEEINKRAEALFKQGSA